MLEPSCSSAGLGFLTPGTSCHPQPTHSAHRNLDLVITRLSVWLLDREQQLLNGTQFGHNSTAPAGRIITKLRAGMNMT